jgi:uncharacterized protein DUF4397
MKRHLCVATLLGAAVLSSCEKNAVQVIPTEPPLAARIKFFNLGVNAPAVNFYANETKMTAILSGTGAESNNGVAYGGVAAGGAYVSIAPGQYTLTGRIAAATDKNRPIATVSTTVADGKYYSFFMSGFYDATAKTVDGFVLEDPYVTPTDYSVATVRFVNAIANGSPLTLYAKSATDSTKPEVALGAAVAYKGAGAFTTLLNDVYDLVARYTDSTTNKITRKGVSFFGGRVYTVDARGDITITDTTATKRPMLDNVANR